MHVPPSQKKLFQPLITSHKTEENYELWKMFSFSILGQACPLSCFPT